MSILSSSLPSSVITFFCFFFSICQFVFTIQIYSTTYFLSLTLFGIFLNTAHGFWTFFFHICQAYNLNLNIFTKKLQICHIMIKLNYKCCFHSHVWFERKKAAFLTDKIPLKIPRTFGELGKIKRRKKAEKCRGRGLNDRDLWKKCPQFLSPTVIVRNLFRYGTFEVRSSESYRLYLTSVGDEKMMLSSSFM